MAAPNAQSVRDIIENLGFDSAYLRKLRPEDPDVTVQLVRPLEVALQSTPELPELPSGTPGRLVASIWIRLHPTTPELPRLLEYVTDDAPVVRFAALEALKASLLADNKNWRDQSFVVGARASLQASLAKEDSRIIAHLLKDVLDNSTKLGRPVRKQRLQVRTNPYVAGMPVRDSDKFFGRNDVMSELGSTLGKRQGIKSFILYGARRSGKTSILLRIQGGALGSAFLSVYVDMQGFAGIDSNTFLSSMARTVAAQCNVSVDPTLPTIKDPDFRLAVQRLMKQVLQSVSQNVILLIDEYEVLLEYIKQDPTLALQLQHLVENEPNLFVVFAGSHLIESVGISSSVPLLDAARYLKITFLSHSDALALVVKPVEDVVSYAPGVAERLVELTAGHPFYIQLICQMLFDKAVSSSGVVTEADLLDATATFVRDPSPHVILTWGALELEEKVASSTLAAISSEASDVTTSDIIARLQKEEYPLVPDAASIRRALTGLCEAGWVEEKLPDSRFRFTMELVRRWVEANRSIRALADEQRSRLLQKLAPAWRQWLAEFIDLVVVAIASGAGGLPILASTQHSLFAWMGAVLAAFLCLALPMWTGRFTIGLRLLRLHPVSRQMAPIGALRATWYALLLLIRFAVLLSTIFMLISFIATDTGVDRHIAVPIFILGSAFILADNASIRVSRLRQGLYEWLSGIALMYRT